MKKTTFRFYTISNQLHVLTQVNSTSRFVIQFTSNNLNYKFIMIQLNILMNQLCKQNYQIQKQLNATTYAPFIYIGSCHEYSSDTNIFNYHRIHVFISMQPCVRNIDHVCQSIVSRTLHYFFSDAC